MRRSAVVRALLLSATALAGAGLSAQAQAKDCEELRAEIESKLRSRGISGFSLAIASPAEVGGGRVVGRCDGGRHRIVYVRGERDVGGAGPGVPAPHEPRPAPPHKPRTTTPPKPAPVPPIGNY